MKKTLIAVALVGGMLTACTQKSNNNQNNESMNTTLELTQEWDKVFPLSEKVNHRKVTFETQYGLTLAADLYTPKDAEGKLAAIAVSGPFGAVKEQCAVNRVAQLHPTSTPRISWLLSIICRSRTMWMQKRSVSSASADGEASP